MSQTVSRRTGYSAALVSLARSLGSGVRTAASINRASAAMRAAASAAVSRCPGAGEPEEALCAPLVALVREIGSRYRLQVVPAASGNRAAGSPVRLT